ncbi:MAG: reactive intermediate/imine deaminase [Candidatus Cloacimonadota bacterium]|nr:MAG: reactive intermediate/imine deaminase [Candidatus Cloacimonadota bacterium]
MKKIIATEKAPKAVGPYSQAVIAGENLFISGQLPIDPATSKFVSEDVAEQTEQCLKNMGEILKEAGMNYDNVVKTTVLLADIKDFVAMNEVYAKFFTENFPARAAFQVANLPLGARVEIEAVAYKG